MTEHLAAFDPMRVPSPVDEWGEFPDYDSTWDAYQDGWQDAVRMLRSLPVEQRMEAMGMEPRRPVKATDAADRWLAGVKPPTSWVEKATTTEGSEPASLVPADPPGDS